MNVSAIPQVNETEASVPSRCEVAVFNNTLATLWHAIKQQHPDRQTLSQNQQAARRSSLIVPASVPTFPPCMSWNQQAQGFRSEPPAH